MDSWVAAAIVLQWELWVALLPYHLWGQYLWLSSYRQSTQALKHRSRADAVGAVCGHSARSRRIARTRGLNDWYAGVADKMSHSP